MSRYSLAILLSVYTCFAWGMITPLKVRLQNSMGVQYHAFTPFVWFGFFAFLLSLTIVVATHGAVLRIQSWHWAVWTIAALLTLVVYLAGKSAFNPAEWNQPALALGFLWASGGVSFVLSLYFASGFDSIPNLIAASYPALISTFALWYFFGEPMPLQKILGFVLALSGVVLVVTSQTR